MKERIPNLDTFVNEADFIHSVKIVKEPIKKNESVNEDALDYKEHAENFIENVLKLGSKNNLFDVYMKKHGLPYNELSDFVNAVVDELNNKWR